MTYNNKKLTKSVFKFSFLQNDDEGNIEVLFFIDENGKSLVLPFDINIDYNEGVEVLVDEYTYRTTQLTLKNVNRAIILASGTDLVQLEREKQERLIEQGRLDLLRLARRTDQELRENSSRVPSNPSTEAKEEKMLRVLFKKNKDVRFKDEATGNIVDLIKYSDAQGNNTYLSFQEHQRIFQSGQVTDFILLEYTYDSLIRDFQRTKLKYPESRTANIKSYSILTGKLLDSNEFDYSILEEIYQGQRNGRDTRFHGEVLEIYNAIFRERNETKVETTQPLPQAEVVIQNVITANDIAEDEVRNGQGDDRTAGWRRGAAKREEQRRMKEQALIDAQARIQHLEGILREVIDQNAELKRQISELKDRNQKLARLESIINGEDPKFFASLHQVNKS